MKRNGIYKMENIETGACYIGRSCDTDRRWSYYKATYKNGNYRYAQLQDGWNKGQEDIIKFDIIEEFYDDDNIKCKEQYWTEREQYWMDYYRQVDGKKVVNKNRASEVQTFYDIEGSHIRRSQAQSGGNNGNSKLTIHDIVIIKALYNSGKYSIKNIADMYEMGQTQIRRIINGEAWKKAI